MLRATGRLYFWTFTFRDVHSLKVAMGLWNQFLTILKRKLGFQGVRVIELHEEHGVHLHVLTNRRYKIRRFLELSERYGFGRIHVVHVDDPEGALRYVCKYLSKRRPKCLRGARLWSAFGDAPRTRVKDVMTDSPFGRLLRAKMGVRSPDEELAEAYEGKPVPEKKVRRSFLKAMPEAQTAYLRSFDPEHDRRQAVWAKLRFGNHCRLSPPWSERPLNYEEED